MISSCPFCGQKLGPEDEFCPACLRNISDIPDLNIAQLISSAKKRELHDIEELGRKWEDNKEFNFAIHFLVRPLMIFIGELFTFFNFDELKKKIIAEELTTIINRCYSDITYMLMAGYTVGFEWGKKLDSSLLPLKSFEELPDEVKGSLFSIFLCFDELFDFLQKEITDKKTQDNLSILRSNNTDSIYAMANGSIITSFRLGVACRRERTYL